MVTVFLLNTGWHVRRSVCCGNRAAVAVRSEGMVVVVIHVWNNLCSVGGWVRWSEWNKRAAILEQCLESSRIATVNFVREKVASRAKDGPLRPLPLATDPSAENQNSSHQNGKPRRRQQLRFRQRRSVGFIQRCNLGQIQMCG